MTLPGALRTSTAAFAMLIFEIEQSKHARLRWSAQARAPRVQASKPMHTGRPTSADELQLALHIPWSWCSRQDGATGNYAAAASAAAAAAAVGADADFHQPDDAAVAAVCCVAGTVDALR